MEASPHEVCGSLAFESNEGKLENDGLIITSGHGRWTIYKLSAKIDDRQNILKQFQFHIEA